MSFALQIPRHLHDEMVAHAEGACPNECCGLLAGAAEPGEGGGVPVARVVRRYPLVNAADSPVRYDAEPKGLVAAFKDMRRLGIDLLAIYHSHPTAEPVPSRTDLEQNFYGPDVMHLIISLKGDEPRVRGWWLDADGFRDAEWQIV
jgi:proteasome lid subunit RPN8/RPN11